MTRWFVSCRALLPRHAKQISWNLNTNHGKSFIHIEPTADVVIPFDGRIVWSIWRCVTEVSFGRIFLLL
jgi:hypothetical protein